MTSSTLGGLIKDYRIQKGISQQEIAFSLGWKETSRLSRIEQGVTEKPPRELLDKIIKALDLTEEQKNSLLLTGSYLPTETEIQNIKSEIAPLLNSWKYPANVLDFSWRSIAQNDKIVKIHNIPEKFLKIIEQNYLRVLDIIFSQPAVATHQSSAEEAGEWEYFLKTAVTNFKHEQRNRTKEKWYINHIKTLMDNELFRKIWVETENEAFQNHIILGKFGEQKFKDPTNPKKFLSFFIFVLPLLKDPRFEINLLVPKDLYTYQFYEKKS